MKLTNPTDDELNAAFAEKVAAWTKMEVNFGYINKGDKTPTVRKEWRDSTGALQSIGDTHFTNSADAVLPWLDKRKNGWQAGKTERGYWVNLGGYEDSVGVTFPRAAVIALLRAHCVEIEFTK
jgi:hypothetical protein